MFTNAKQIFQHHVEMAFAEMEEDPAKYDNNFYTVRYMYLHI